MLKNKPVNQIETKEKKINKDYNYLFAKYKSNFIRSNNNKLKNDIVKISPIKLKNTLNSKQKNYIKIKLQLPKKINHNYLYDLEKKMPNNKQNYITLINKKNNSNIVEKIEINKLCLSTLNLNEKSISKKLKRNNSMLNNNYNNIHLKYNNIKNNSINKNVENLSESQEINEMLNLSKFKDELKIISNKHDDINKNIYINIKKISNLLDKKEPNSNGNHFINELKNTLKEINFYLLDIVKNKEDEYSLILNQKDQDLFYIKQHLNNLKIQLKTKNEIINELIT